MRVVAALSVVVAAAGCAEPGDLFGPPERPPVIPRTTVGEAPPPAITRPEPPAPEPPIGTSVETQADARLEGSLGSVRRVQASGLEVLQQRMGAGGAVEAHAEDRAARWWVMTRLAFSTPLTSEAWAPGSSYTISARAPSNPLGLTVIGCSGPSRNNFTYDGAPTQVEVRVDAGPTPSSRVLTFVERWEPSGDELRGVVTVSPQ